MSRQKNNFSSGSPIVDQMYGMEITGNVIPLNWFKTITTANGKPNSTAIMLLSDIVYWYRPKILRDEATGEFIGIKKRFKADLLQRSYRQFFRAVRILQKTGHGSNKGAGGPRSHQKGVQDGIDKHAEAEQCPVYRIVPRQAHGAHLSGENRERHITFKCDTYYFKK